MSQVAGSTTSHVRCFPWESVESHAFSLACRCSTSPKPLVPPHLKEGESERRIERCNSIGIIVQNFYKVQNFMSRDLIVNRQVVISKNQAPRFGNAPQNVQNAKDSQFLRPCNKMQRANPQPLTSDRPPFCTFTTFYITPSAASSSGSSSSSWASACSSSRR